ncbi:hypothetical protein HYV43_03480 [Candidatus Micrarchaeota archaeon]|nr:hypothetical protein [Candidatus Micrarchaeota archaeon]
MPKTPRTKSINLTGTGPIGMFHRRFTPQSPAERYAMKPGSWHPGWQKLPFHAVWQDNIAAAMKRRNAAVNAAIKRMPKKTNVVPNARRTMRRPTRR